MAKIENKDFNVEMQIRAIELLNVSLQLPADSNITVTSFNFNISIESKVDAPNNLIFVIVNVEIKNDDHSLVLGTLSVSCIFEIANLVEVVKTEKNGNLDIPHWLIETLNTISVSTARGVMFSTFKGTFLHGAVLPLIDPRQF